MKDAETAKEATDKVINEEKVDPSKWADFIKDKKDLDKLINELGGTVDVRRQTRVSEKTGEQYISYALKGEKGNAIIGKNGHILRTNIDEDMALSQQKEAAK
jgi:predicted RNA-binding protein Jag